MGCEGGAESGFGRLVGGVAAVRGDVSSGGRVWSTIWRGGRVSRWGFTCPIRSGEYGLQGHGGSGGSLSRVSDERAREVWPIRSDRSHSERQHDHQCEAHASLHFAETADRVPLETEYLVDPAVDPLD